MRLYVFLLLISLPFAIPSFAQDTPTRDARAVALLQQSLMAMGAGNAQNIADTRSDVTIRSNEDGRSVEQTAVWKTLGRKAWRVESPEGSGVFIANEDWAISKSGTDEQDFPTVSIAEAGNWRIPFLSVLADWADTAVGVESVETHDKSIHHIRLQKRPKNAGLAEVVGPCDVYLDAQTLLPVKLAFSLHPAENLLVDIPAEVEYADYKLMSGLLIPTHIRYSIQGHLVNEFFVTSFSVNTGASPAEFKVR